MTPEFVCPSTAGPGPCMNTTPHHTPPLNCVHSDSNGSWVPDRHDKPGRDDHE